MTKDTADHTGEPTPQPVRDGEPAVEREPGFPSRSGRPDEDVRATAVELALALRDDKCQNVVVLDVRALSQLADYIVIGSGTSDRQMHSAIQDLEEISQEINAGSCRTNGDDRSTWMLADFGDVVVHLFEPMTRAHYDLEMMWGDAPRIEVPDRPSRLAGRRAAEG
ncbi:MAG: ribosome silencing factor [Planctomycetota bacterium]